MLVTDPLSQESLLIVAPVTVKAAPAVALKNEAEGIVVEIFPVFTTRELTPVPDFNVMLPAVTEKTTSLLKVKSAARTFVGRSDKYRVVRSTGERANIIFSRFNFILGFD